MRREPLIRSLLRMLEQSLQPDATEVDREFAAKAAVNLVPLLLRDGRVNAVPLVVRLVKSVDAWKRPASPLAWRLKPLLEHDKELRRAVEDLVTSSQAARRQHFAERREHFRRIQEGAV